MAKTKAILSLCCAAVLCLSGCSRQQSDWEKTRAANTTDSYEQFLKKYPSGEFTAQAQARVKELYEERDWQKARDADTLEAYQAFLKQYPEGKWTEEARIRVENFSLAQAPSNAAAGDAANTVAMAPAVSPDLPPSTSTHNTGDTVAAALAAASPKPAPKPAAAVPAPATAPASGAYGIQLGAFKSSAGTARQRWARLDKDYPHLLSGLSPTVAPKKTPSGTLYRLQATGLTEQRARAICASLKAKAQACVIVPPG